ncbi:MAG: hypothetical protein FWD11_10035, partial [Micrococcales bacterium]|nr:hypothetical protein [Micrococcales bacterium]
MAKNPRLDEAVAIFKELGWADATYADVPTLSLGSAAQRKAALAGLRTGDWGELGYVPGKGTRWRVYTDVDTRMLLLFAVRLGLGARRAATVYQQVDSMPRTKVPTLQVVQDAFFTVLAAQDQTYTETFVRHTSRVSGTDLAVRLVACHQLPVPESSDYLMGWEAFVTDHGWHRRWCWSSGHDDTYQVSEEVLLDRFAEHLRAAFSAGLTPNGAAILGVDKGLVDRDEIVDLMLAALDGATAPSRRRDQLAAWLDGLHVTDEEILARVDVLVPILATGDPTVIERLAPVLIAGVVEALLPDVATAALTAPTKKAVRSVLQALAARPRPSDATVATIGPQVTALDARKDPALARAQQAVVDAWSLGVPDVPEPSSALGLWRPTPPVWTPPRFDRGEETPEALERLTVELVQRSGFDGWAFDEPDLVFERFLAVANAVAQQDPAVVRTVLRGVQHPTVYLWVNDPAGVPYVADWNPLTARTAAVFAQLGKVPCVLSEPSTVDLHVSPSDLVTRLRAYLSAGASAREEDLFLALTRLDVSLVDTRVRAELDQLTVPVLLRSDRPMAVTAGPAASRYLENPVGEPALAFEYDQHRDEHFFRWTNLHMPDSVATVDETTRIVGCWSFEGDPSTTRTALMDALFSQADVNSFPDRFRNPTRGFDADRPNGVFPAWGDPALYWFWQDDDGVPDDPDLFWCGLDDNRLDVTIGPATRQVARRAAPLPPGSAANLLELSTRVNQPAVANLAAAVTEAWERGLLRPGVPDLSYLDWHSPRLAARAKAFADAAGDGLLSLVWPLLDDLAARAAGAVPSQCRCGRPYQPTDRLLAGASDVVGVIA